MPGSFSVLRHDVPRFLLAQKRREETKDVFIASKMRPDFGCLQVICVSGSFKRKEKKAQIKNLGTPLLLNFKILGGGTPPDPGSYRRMFAVHACLYEPAHVPCGWKGAGAVFFKFLGLDGGPGLLVVA